MVTVYWLKFHINPYFFPNAPFRHSPQIEAQYPEKTHPSHSLKMLSAVHLNP
jgi:hypothetical protein